MCSNSPVYQKKMEFPTQLNKVVRTNVSRPKKTDQKDHDHDQEEILIIDVEIQRCDEYVKFDVYINDEDDKVPSKENQVKTEYAGSFVNVPHHHHSHRINDNDHHDDHKMMMTSLKLGLSELIEDLGADDDDDDVIVSLIPKSGIDNVVIKGIKLRLNLLLDVLYNSPHCC
ncbi:polyphenol oxidase, chloroplastic-like [Amaranthus tricolor]|uniref:polyphenol oxidase, chloroplastic-like n=1 Tax=Amaranthus tricolor TaxID=29722 RepID=UPI00258C9361|nr:polyphenol oxidase, chloroplastic-like [Amaranthus tricolor]